MTDALRPSARFTEIRKLTEVSRALTYAVSPEDVLRLTVDHAADVLSVERVALMLADTRGELVVRASRGIDDAVLQQLRAAPPDTLIHRLHEVFDGPRARFLGVPLVTGGAVTGTLAVGLSANPDADLDEEEWLLSALADQAAVAIEKTRLHETAPDAEHRFRLAVESTGIGTWEYTPATGSLSWDGRCKALFNVGADAPDRYDAFLAAIHPDDRPRVHDCLQRSLQSAGTDTFHVECRPVSPEGYQRWVMANGHAFFDSRGEPARVLGTALDVTDRKRREEELQANEERFRRLSVELEQANRTKDQFLMTLSHELRTPLTATAGWVRLLQSAKLSTEQAARALDVIGRNVKTQTRIVDDLLDVSRMATGELKVHPIWCDASAVIEAATDAIRPAAVAKDIRVDAVVEPDAVKVFADPERLQQILWHVLANAVKFTGRWGQVALTCRRIGRDVEIAVSDNGEGIAPQFIPFVFDRFAQADASPRREHGGQGLGLAIVRHLVTLHGGSASAHSDGKGLGTTITVRLPLPAAAQESSDRPDDTPIRWPA